MSRVISFFLSLKLTVVLLGLSMFLVLAGTLAQIDQGIWVVVDQYFRCIIAWIDLPVFFPRSWPIPSLRFPFPGGFLIGTLLVMNLLAVHTANFKILAKGKRKALGFGLLAFGILVTLGVMFGWGTAPVAATENAAFWRVFWRLGRGTVAAIALYAACVALYRKRAGMVLMHAGILFLMIGEFMTALYAVESSMTIAEGERVGYIDHARRYELAFTDTTNPEYDQVIAIPDRKLRTGATITHPELPFELRINRFMANSSQPRPLDTLPEELRANYPAYEGYGGRLHVAALPPTADGNAPAIDLDLIDPESGKSLGRYVLSLWFYPNFVNRSWDMPQSLHLAGRTYTVYLRPKREYLVSPSGNPYTIELLDFVHERYEGTQMPKDFSSRIILQNPGDDVERELKIWMNNPLRYAHRTFYQAGYLPDDKGTVLQVVRNDSWMIPYLACMIVFTGMTAQFIQSLGRYLRRDA